MELYQSGDANFLVATDAIGMGINMDIDNVSFANLKKFDGKKTRKLNLSEISQIAGRAGRHINDGTFGITGECKQLSSDEIEKLENHELNKIDVLYWRNSDINFDSLENLIASLEKKINNNFIWLVYIIASIFPILVLMLLNNFFISILLSISFYIILLNLKK